MGKLGVVIRREYLERVRSRWFVFATLLGPLFFGGISIGQIVLTQHAGVSADASHIIVIDETGTNLGQRVVANLGAGVTTDTSNAMLQVVSRGDAPTAEANALNAVMHNKWVGYLVLNDSTLAGKGARYNGRNASALQDIDHVRDVVKNAVLTERLVGAGLDPAQIRSLTTVPLELHTERVTDRGLGGSGMSGAWFGYIVAILLYITIVVYGQSIVRGVSDEKASRVSEVVVSSAPPDTLLAGKILGVGGVAITQQIIWTALSIAIVSFRAPILRALGASASANIPLPGSISLGAGIELALIFLLGFFFYAALFAAIGATVESQEDAQQASLPVTMLLVLSIMFVGPVFLSPTSTLARVVSWIPFSAPILMPLRLALIQVPTLEIAGTILGLLVANFIAIWFAARVYRVGILMYGKRRSLAEIIRWVRVS
ncbi:MAG TPA: ABC transporter permease [Gemmatimonadaceae bacterium]|nr:ABC transporter permease [Gemmatimonadaceae bacterium]